MKDLTKILHLKNFKLLSKFFKNVSLKVNLIPHTHNLWITGGIKVSCHNKSISYVVCMGSNDNNLKLRYKILQDINRCCKNRKKMYYDEIISKLKNKTKSTGKIIKKE